MTTCLCVYLSVRLRFSVSVCLYVRVSVCHNFPTKRLCCYGVASMSRLLTIIGLFGKRALQKRLYSAKEAYNFKEPTNRSHPICVCGAPVAYRFVVYR